MEKSEKLAFWLNVYNLLGLHAVVLSASQNENPLNSYFTRKRFFASTYIIADLTFSLDDIEKGILRPNNNYFNEGDIRLSHRIETPDPRVFSVLNCFYKTSPKPLLIRHSHVERYINYACRRHFSVVKFQDTTIFLPKVCDYYSSDYGTKDDLLNFIQKYLKPELNQQIKTHRTKLYIKFIEFEWDVHIELSDCDLDPDDPKLKENRRSRSK